MNKRNDNSLTKRGDIMPRTKSKNVSKPRYPRLSRLKGLMAQYKITVAQMSKAIGRAISTVSKANNGYNLYDSMDMLNIQNLINSRSETKYSIDDIFFGQ
jgi:hypothetical protein